MSKGNECSPGVANTIQGREELRGQLRLGKREVCYIRRLKMRFRPHTPHGSLDKNICTWNEHQIHKHYKVTVRKDDGAR